MDFNLVLLRHGQSVWNRENRFTGWKDVGLSRKGVQEAGLAGRILKARDFRFERAFTSVLKRAIQTLWWVLKEGDLLWVPVVKTWRLNERHYGALTGLNKKEVAKIYGPPRVHLWRRSYETKPPPLSPREARDLLTVPVGVLKDRFKKKILPGCYRDLKTLPCAESLKTTGERVMPFWKKEVRPCLQKGEKVLIVAHGNSLRALVRELEGLSGKEIEAVNIPTGVPVAYALSPKSLKVQGKKVWGKL